MALALVHAFSSGKADGTDNTLVQPSNWNAQHTLTLNGNSLVGNATAGNAAATEIACTAQGRAILAAATLADLIAAGIPIFSTGDVKFTIKTAADTGWVICNDGTIGNDGSGATSLASTALAATLYTLIWTNISNTWAAIQDSTGAATTRGGSAAADFAASKRLPLTKMLGRSLAIAGGGSGLTARALGQILGEESHTLTTAEMPSHAHGGATGAHAHSLQTILTSNSIASFTVGAANTVAIAVSNGQSTDSATAPITAEGGGTTHNNMQPTSFLNAMIKL